MWADWIAAPTRRSGPIGYEQHGANGEEDRERRERDPESLKQVLGNRRAEEDGRHGEERQDEQGAEAQEVRRGEAGGGGRGGQTRPAQHPVLKRAPDRPASGDDLGRGVAGEL